MKITFFKLWCAGVLCPHKNLRRFHLTCLTCRWRREYLGRWHVPTFMLMYKLPWLQEDYLAFDLRGHRAFTWFRLCIIKRIVKIATYIPRKYRRNLLTVCEIIQNLTW